MPTTPACEIIEPPSTGWLPSTATTKGSTLVYVWGYPGYVHAVSPSDITTIKVSKGLRDRISAGAAQQHQTVQRFIENVIDAHERGRRLAAVAEAMHNADERTLGDWRAETDLWETADGDAGPGA